MRRLRLTLRPALRFAAAASLIAALPPAARAQVDIPAMRDKAVHDYAGVVLVEDSEVVEQVARVVARKSGLRMTAVTVKSLEGESPDALARRWMADWSLGPGQGDRSLFMLVAAGEGKVALEASPGASDIFTEQARQAILEGSMRPYLQRGDYSLGIRRGMEEAARMAAEGYGFEIPDALSSPFPESLLARGGSLALLLCGILVVALGVPALLWWLLLGTGRNRNLPENRDS